jgi:hypothetical protein
MNQQMDWMGDAFGDKLNRLRGNMTIIMVGVQNRPEQREFNVRSVFMRFNTDMDKFVSDNTNMNGVDFENVSDSSRIFSLKGKDMVTILVIGIIIGTETIMWS